MIPFPEQAPTPAARARNGHTRGLPRLPCLPHRRRLKPSDPRSWNLTLASAGTAVPARIALGSPELLAAAMEDLEWRLAWEELRARRPHRWRKSAMAAWRAEADRLDAERRRIAELAAEAVNAL